jgi:hypothetical protein
VAEAIALGTHARYLRRVFERYAHGFASGNPSTYPQHCILDRARARDHELVDQVLNLRQPLVAQVWYGLSNTLEPVYRRIRKMIPISGGIDFAPLIVFFGIIALEIVVSRNFY